MMDTANTKKQKLNSQVMQLQQLIAAPLVATLEADAMTTQSYLSFLREVAFEPSKDNPGDLGKLRTFVFQYTQNENGQKITKSVQVPIISLVPIPLLQIKEAVFDFDIKILDSETESAEESFSFDENQRQSNDNIPKMSMRAALTPQSGKSSSQKENSMSANMKVKVVMHQADMPAGLGNLLSLSANNFSVESVPEPEKEQDQPRPFTD